MRRTLSVITSRYSAVALLWVGLAVIWNGPAVSPALGSEPPGPRVRNSTRSFRVVAVEKSEDGDYRLSLKNEYAKAITAFRVLLPNSRTSIREDFLTTRASIAPGSVEVIELPASKLKPLAGEASLNEANVLITAVAFEDKTGDGRPDAVAEMEAERFGEKAQLTRAVSQLRRVLETGDTQLIASLDSLKSEVWAADAASDLDSLAADFRSEKSSLEGSPDEAIKRGLACGLKNGLKRSAAIFAELEPYRSIGDGTSATVITAKIRELSAKLISDYERLIDKL